MLYKSHCFVSPFRQNELIKGIEYVLLVRHTMKFTIVFRKTTNTLVPGLAFYNVPKFVFGYTIFLTFPRRNNYALHSPLTLMLSSGSPLLPVSHVPSLGPGFDSRS